MVKDQKYDSPGNEKEDTCLFQSETHSRKLTVIYFSKLRLVTKILLSHFINGGFNHALPKRTHACLEWLGLRNVDKVNGAIFWN